MLCMWVGQPCVLEACLPIYFNLGITVLKKSAIFLVGVLVNREGGGVKVDLSSTNGLFLVSEYRGLR